ncbi:DUF3352 domain-containing protein [Calothrix sp. 336/3]|uniref:DUF3352 domain-containing protein n=1 Tax=Calothrix sp. 336/3 TaxID=1337936 RepID=UPI0004E2F0B3|nr:DUF3352 domain-containing protein [Calothrix sp. 336/3]AKG22448.1 hypothetical protein IJ00_15290 [Calothrix sp. 336/3]
MKKSKKPSLLLTFSATGLLIGGGFTAYWWLNQGHLFARNLPVGANIIPQDAVFTVSLTTDSSQWQKLQQFGNQENRTELEKNLQQLRDRYLTSRGYDFQKDIQPWVGEQVTVAVLSSEATKPASPSKPVATDTITSNVEESMVVVLPIKDQQKAQTILGQTVKGSKWQERNFQGVIVRESTEQNGEKFSAAVLENKYVVITDNPKATDRAIAAYQTKTTLASSAGYTNNLSRIGTSQPFAQFYVNVPYSARIAAASPNRRLPAQVLTQLQNNQGLAGTINVESQGIRLKGISWLNPTSQRTLTANNGTKEMANRLPSETLMMLSGTNLRSLWIDYASTSQGNPLAPVTPEQLRSNVKSLTNLDLDQDLLSWMGGEFAVAVIPGNVNQTDFQPGLVFMIKTSDRPRAELALKQLDEVIATQYQLQVQTEKVADKSLVNWVVPAGGKIASHGWLDNNVAFLAFGTPVNNKIIPQPINNLASNPQFQKVVPTVNQSVNSQFFLDVEKSSQNFPLFTIFPKQQALLSATRSLGITSSISDSRTSEYEVFWELKRE